MPKILMLTPYLPYPPVSGGRMRTYSLVKRLCKDYEITLVCFGRPEERAFDLEPMREFCNLIVVDRESSPGTLKAAIMSVTTVKPITMRLYTSPEMRETVSKLLNEKPFDAIHVESFYMLQNIPPDSDVPVLLSEPAIEYIAWERHARVAQPAVQRPGILLEALKMRFFEPRIWRKAQIMGAMSEIDAQIITRNAPEIKTILAPNGVDTDFFRPGEKERAPATAIYMGDYKYFPNTDAARFFVEAIMPLIRAQRPDFTLTLLGKDPPADLVALANDPASGITVTGLVEDTRPYLAEATLFICPLRSGSGTRFKLMEALACGLPVVSTRVGAEGLNPVDGENMLLADSAPDFAQAVLTLLENPGMATDLARKGREWVVENHGWDRSAAFIADAYRDMIESD